MEGVCFFLGNAVAFHVIEIYMPHSKKNYLNRLQ